MFNTYTVLLEVSEQTYIMMHIVYHRNQESWCIFVAHPSGWCSLKATGVLFNRAHDYICTETPQQSKNPCSVSSELVVSLFLLTPPLIVSIFSLSHFCCAAAFCMDTVGSWHVAMDREREREGLIGIQGFGKNTPHTPLTAAPEFPISDNGNRCVFDRGTDLWAYRALAFHTPGEKKCTD